MFSKRNLFAAFLILALAWTAAVAQTPPAAPAPPRIEGFTQFFTDGNGGYLGVQTQEVTKENFSKFGLREVRGVAIEKVVENSPAAQAGLQDNDVIVQVNGEEITSVRKLTRLLGEIAPDHKARITILRGGSEREITATLGKRPGATFSSGGSWTAPGLPTPAPMPNILAPTIIAPINPDALRRAPDGSRQFFSFGSARQIGVGVSALNRQLGDYFGVSDGKGLLINNVHENSAGAKAGLRAGDIIVEVDGKAVATMGELTRAINEKKEGDVSLTIIRNKNRQTIRVTPEKAAEGENIQRLRELMLQENGSVRVPSRQLTRPSRVPFTLNRLSPRTL